MLKTLDRNRDTNLTADEVAPDESANEAALYLSRLDRNNDGSVSQEEWPAREAGPLRSLLDQADRDRNGVVSGEELSNELRLRNARDQILRNAAGSIPRNKQ